MLRSPFFGGNSQSLTPITVYASGKKVYLQYKNGLDEEILTAASEDGFSFGLCERYRLNSEEGETTRTKIHEFTDETAARVMDYQYNRQFILYYGNRAIKVAYSPDLIEWHPASRPLIMEAQPVQVAHAFCFKHVIVMVYFKKVTVDRQTYFKYFLALIDQNNPEKILWRSPHPIWDQKDHWPGREARPIGTVLFKGRIMTYWQVDRKMFYATILPGFDEKLDVDRILAGNRTVLEKHASNPIISPHPDHEWEAFNTFNPAAVYADDRVHIFYRAQGYDYISSVGYAVSSDGLSIHEKMDYPVYEPGYGFETNGRQTANPAFISGGGLGGCEDPRTTIINGRLYMVYVAFDGWSPPRLAMTSILLENFLKRRWLWSKPVLISPPGIIDKSGCLFPEKIRGKYVFLHRVFPNILLDYVDDLNFDGKTRWLKGEYRISVRPDKWDSRKIGAGAPPIKTEDGWLLIYYGVDDRDAGKYHIGAMLLDLNYPEKVLYRTDKPILGPTEDYENIGFKPGIAYPCGAVTIGDKLYVYYGGADSYVCAATADLKRFLQDLKSQRIPGFDKVQIREVIV